MSLPRIGVLTNDRLQQHLLKSSLLHFGFDVVLSSDPSQLKELTTDSLTAWIVDYPCEDESSLSWLDELLDGQIPVLMGVEKAPQKTCPSFPKWEKKLYAKLRDFGSITPTLVADDASRLEQLTNKSKARIPKPTAFADRNFTQQTAPFVWVLGASLGGPEAVKAFLDALPEGLPIAFIYAQHIDPRFEATLCKTIGRHSAYHLKSFQVGEPLRCSEVLVAPIEHEFAFSTDGLPYSLGQDWPGPYGPSIDQVISNTGQGFGARTGIILFSGMGNDGAEAISNLHNDKIPVWVQTPQSCANASMPESAIATGRVSYIGDPHQLALQLVNWIKHHWIPNHEPITH